MISRVIRFSVGTGITGYDLVDMWFDAVNGVSFWVDA